ncbi:rhodanese-like domain-containing protein 11, chloroplastic isoform X1 [Rhodamnia argentea]|uniref:Rhodanese-like domain-containing protein 11, chloroplastic isoform X1 n=1 Tax=Rhodamnia argentea TaxID=178133 RepID=A0A8B8P8X4_9MYRT|nr:rhodanese-like domain-containing protein 11, chloroplastic isoform X1 [Rhodamnia argentea]
MEALGLPSLRPLTISQSTTSRRVQTAKSSWTKTHSPQGFMELPSLGLSSTFEIRLKKRSVIRMIADMDDYDLKQMKDMAAARKRWDSLIREQKVKCLTPREAGYAIQLSDKTLLDVRPSVERNKAWVKGSTWIPIFDDNSGFDPGTLSRKMTSFVMGGWWSGAPTLSYNKQFLPSIEEKFPKDSDLIVACQKGLRSLAACELLYNAGYRSLFWVQGGLEASEEEDLPREGPQPLKFAGIGGVSEFLGWTDQQRATAAKEGWTYQLVFSARLVGLFLVADALFLGGQQLGRYIQELRTH